MSNRDPFFDQWERDFGRRNRKAITRTGVAILGIWVLSALVSISFTVALIWAIVKVVNHYA